MTGFDVCRILKADPELCMIPVLFLSGSGTSDDKVRGLDLGAVDYITKPFDDFELRARVRAAIRTKELQDLLIEHAHIDPLTGLPNRRALMDRLQMEWARMQRHGGELSFIMADIDHFKRVNDTYGHSIGDKVLQEVARTIARQCRESDLPARYGGEEFAVVVPNEGISGAVHLAERCRREIEKVNLPAKGEPIRPTASFGVADAVGVSSAELLVDRADQALYRAKAAGRNRVAVWPKRVTDEGREESPARCNMNRANVTSHAVLSVDDDAAKSAPLTRLIAYLSLCMLAAAFGAMVGPAWSRWWAIFGAFGLISAIGLDVLNRSRARRADHTRRKRLALKAERKLDEMMGDMESSDAIRAALRQFQPDATDPTPQGTNRQAEPRLPLDKPATITRLLRSSGDAGYRLGEPLAGRVRNISRHGFGLAHDQRLERGFVLLEIDLENGEPLQFIADVLWCELQDSGCYFSGGKILEVVSPSDARPAHVP